MSVNDTDWGTEDSRERSRLRILLDQYRALLYTFGVAVLLAVLGATIDAASGSLTDSTKLAHQTAGLLGAAALALGICLLLIIALWSLLVVTDR
ncbi:hypothetical protein [Natrinema sp. SYSU A 869]|uniref:hypothetical protein n=1 Tax=Natrinema sp. SYSU A 869 TaxID=2871694 RepID=UPI001CA4129F|nr:hypothetical protein [Natrinema sp. SYSU A 869]